MTDLRDATRDPFGGLFCVTLQCNDIEWHHYHYIIGGHKNIYLFKERRFY